MIPSGVISLLTDFGLSDPYVGVMKGVILREHAHARIVDLCHEVPAQDVRAGAFWLSRSYAYFPTGTVHVAVVDPGVGSDRAALLVLAHGQAFLGPDNGLLASLAAAPGASCRRLDPGALELAPLSRTFHGRDLFAPVAARLAAGALAPAAAGPEARVSVPSLLPAATELGEELHGEVIWVDHFGNALTNLEAARVSKHRALWLQSGQLPIVGTYAEAAPGQCVGLIGSFGVLEIAQRDGSAARALSLSRGCPVILRP